jgi:hypothetical protein
MQQSKINGAGLFSTSRVNNNNSARFGFHKFELVGVMTGHVRSILLASFGSRLMLLMFMFTSLGMCLIAVCADHHERREGSKASGAEGARSGAWLFHESQRKLGTLCVLLSNVVLPHIISLSLIFCSIWIKLKRATGCGL